MKTKQKRLTGEIIQGERNPELPGAIKEEVTERKKRPAEFIDTWCYHHKRF